MRERQRPTNPIPDVPFDFDDFLTTLEKVGYREPLELGGELGPLRADPTAPGPFDDEDD